MIKIVSEYGTGTPVASLQHKIPALDMLSCDLSCSAGTGALPTCVPKCSIDVLRAQSVFQLQSKCHSRPIAPCEE